MGEFFEGLKTYAGIGVAIGGGFAAFLVFLLGWKNQLQQGAGDSEVTAAYLEARFVTFRTEIYTEIDRRAKELRRDVDNLNDELKETQKELRRRR